MTDYLTPQAFMVKHPQFRRVEYHKSWGRPDFYIMDSEFIFRETHHNLLPEMKADMIAVRNWTIEVNDGRAYRTYQGDKDLK